MSGKHYVPGNVLTFSTFMRNLLKYVTDNLTNLLFLCLYAVLYMLSLLPMPVLYRFSNGIYRLVFHVFSYRKSVVVQNLSRAFPDKKYNEIGRIMSGFYRSFCDNTVEILKSMSIPARQQKEKVLLVDFDIIEGQIRQGKQVIASMGHCGNWEILNILPLMLDVDVHAVYQPLRAKCIDRLFLKIRSRFGANLISSKSIVRHLISNRDRPSLYIFLADQCPRVIRDSYSFRFLHQTTSVFSGVEKLARMINSAVVYFHVVKTSRGIYRVECKEISLDSKRSAETEITRDYVRHLERNILEKPSDWLWSHKRWKR